MRSVTVIGAAGFVGSAFVRLLRDKPGIDLTCVEIDNYAALVGRRSDVVIEAGCNSRKYIAEERPAEDFDLSVAHRLRTLMDFPAGLHVHISSADVYDDLSDPERTREDVIIDESRASNYGFHKLLAEKLVRRYAGKWLILRLAGMVGPFMKKNPVYDILHGHPLRIRPDSQYQFIATDEVARIAWGLVEDGVSGDVFNICGRGLISPKEIAEIANAEIFADPHAMGDPPRIVNINIEKIAKMAHVGETRDSVVSFLKSRQS